VKSRVLPLLIVLPPALALLGLFGCKATEDSPAAQDEPARLPESEEQQETGQATPAKDAKQRPPDSNPSRVMSDRGIPTQPDRDLQAKIDSLKIGDHGLDAIKRKFGEPETWEKGVDWHDRTGKARTMYTAGYESLGLSFALFTNPSELYDYTTTNAAIAIRKIRLGDTLASVREKLGKGEWRTSAAQDWWWLEFEQIGLKVGFERDGRQPKFPIKLSRPEVVTKLQRFNKRVSFR